jgi:hypothetical protein
MLYAPAEGRKGRAPSAVNHLPMQPLPHLLPLVVGVSGHRDIPVEAEMPLRERFREFLSQMRAVHPASPLVILTGLAAGADMLAAEEALELGVPVFAALPMPRERYEADFTADQLPRFRRILEQCFKVAVAGSFEEPERNYIAAGTYIAYYSQLLVVFWDGERGGGPGGTADVVRMRERGVVGAAAEEISPYIPDVGPIYHIVTPRAGRPVPPNVFTLTQRLPHRFSGDVTLERDVNDALKRYDLYNSDLNGFPYDASQPALASLAQRTDEAAGAFQRRHFLTLRILYLTAFVAGGVQLVFDSLLIGNIVKLGALLGAFVIFRLARRRDDENRYQDYRALAEGLKVQRAWCAAGLSAFLVESSYLQMQQSELQWIRMALRTAYLLYVSGEPECDGSPANPAFTEWCDEQWHFYRNRALQQDRVAARYEWTGAAAMIAALIVTVVATAALAAGSAQSAGAVWDRLATAPLAIAALGALLMRFYVEQRGYRENVRRYQHMFIIFDLAKRRLAASADPERSLQLAHELGREALTEHANWLMLHRQRPLSFVHS